jgi:hypothetical protein
MPLDRLADASPNPPWFSGNYPDWQDEVSPRQVNEGRVHGGAYRAAGLTPDVRAFAGLEPQVGTGIHRAARVSGVGSHRCASYLERPVLGHTLIRPAPAFVTRSPVMASLLLAISIL